MFIKLVTISEHEILYTISLLHSGRKNETKSEFSSAAYAKNYWASAIIVMADSA